MLLGAIRLLHSIFCVRKSRLLGAIRTRAIDLRSSHEVTPLSLVHRGDQ